MRLISTLAILLAVLFGGCSGSGKKIVEPPKPEPIEDPRLSLPLDEQLRLKIQDELASGVVYDSIILDHQFGMSRKEVFRHKNKLMRDKRIYGVYKTKNTRAFVYDLDLAQSGKTRTYFDTFYHQDELYIMECKPVIPKGKKSPQIWEEMVTLFELKYGKPDFIMPLEEADSTNTYACPNAIWIDGNLKVEIKCKDKDALIYYTDLIREKEKLADI